MITTFRATSFSIVAVSRVVPKSKFCLQLHHRYHSYQHPPLTSPFTDTESKILAAALHHVPSHGFSTTAMSLGACDVGYLGISVNLFSRGVFDLVKYHLITERFRLKEKVDFKMLEQEDGARKVNVAAKIRTLCVERLKANTPIIHRWQEALGIMSLGENIPTSVSELAKLSDEIWFLSGDDSYDMNWYTKRAMLSGVYASTELFMTQDTSADFEETWRFLDRRLNDTKWIGNATSNITEWVEFTTHAFKNVLRSKNFPLL